MRGALRRIASSLAHLTSVAVGRHTSSVGIASGRPCRRPLSADPLDGVVVAPYRVVAAILCLLFAALAGLHFYWVAGGRLALEGALPAAGDRPLFTPGPLAGAAIGLALTAAAIVSALRGGLLSLELPARWAEVGTWVLALLFALRAIGDFRYVGFFKRVRGTLFARRDSLVYTPLCLLISMLAVALSLLAP